MNKRDFVRQIPAFATLMADADVIDIKTIDGDLPMRDFIANLLSYQPAWITFLYRVRGGFVRLLGMTQEGVPRPQRMSPDDVSMIAGDAAYFFTVRAAEEDRFWIAGEDDNHLNVHLGVTYETLGNTRRYFVVTIVHHNSWQGPVYYNVIRPFHHLVVNAMMRHAIKPHPGTTRFAETS